MEQIIDKLNKKYTKKQLPDVMTGDVVQVSQKIKEGGKTRTQIFEGVVISRDGGKGIVASITVRKIASGVGVEKKFLLNSPLVEKIKVLRSSVVRRKKIFYLRNISGKAAKLKDKQRKILEEIGASEETETPEEAELAPLPQEERKEASVEGGAIEDGKKETDDNEKGE